MKSLTFALLVSATSATEATEMSTNVRCNVDRDAKDTDGNAIGSDAALWKYATGSPETVVMSSAKDAAECLTEAKSKAGAG